MINSSIPKLIITTVFAGTMFASAVAQEVPISIQQSNPGGLTSAVLAGAQSVELKLGGTQAISDVVMTGEYKPVTTWQKVKLNIAPAFPGALKNTAVVYAYEPKDLIEAGYVDLKSFDKYLATGRITFSKKQGKKIIIRRADYYSASVKSLFEQYSKGMGGDTPARGFCDAGVNMPAAEKLACNKSLVEMLTKTLRARIIVTTDPKLFKTAKPDKYITWASQQPLVDAQRALENKIIQ